MAPMFDHDHAVQQAVLEALKARVDVSGTSTRVAASVVAAMRSVATLVDVVLATFANDFNRAGAISSLPLELLHKIFVRLNVAECIKASHVCRPWREALLADAMLWTELHFDIRHLGGLTHLLSRTKDVPVRLRFEMKDQYFGIAEQSRQDCRAVVSQLARCLDMHLPHLERLELCLAAFQVDDLSEVLFSLSAPAPCLEHLDLHVIELSPNTDSIECYLRSDILGRQPGQLRYITLTGITLPVDGFEAFAQVETFAYRAQNCDTLSLQFLSKMPLMKSLVIQPSSDYVIAGWPTMQVSKLPSLEYIELSGHASALTVLLNALDHRLIETIVVERSDIAAFVWLTRDLQSIEQLVMDFYFDYRLMIRLNASDTRGFRRCITINVYALDQFFQTLAPVIQRLRFLGVNEQLWTLLTKHVAVPRLEMLTISLDPACPSDENHASGVFLANPETEMLVCPALHTLRLASPQGQEIHFRTEAGSIFVRDYQWRPHPQTLRVSVHQIVPFVTRLLKFQAPRLARLELHDVELLEAPSSSALLACVEDVKLIPLGRKLVVDGSLDLGVSVVSV